MSCRTFGDGNLVSLVLRTKVLQNETFRAWPFTSVWSLKILTLDIDCTFLDTVTRSRFSPLAASEAY